MTIRRDSPLGLTVSTPPAVVTADRLEVWVPGRLVNPLNAREHHFRKAQRVKRERDATAQALWYALNGAHGGPWRVTDHTVPKAITLTLHTARAWDDDALPGGVKAHRDALQGIVVQGDAPADGHVWTYRQVVTRGWAGVQIAVTRR